MAYLQAGVLVIMNMLFPYAPKPIEINDDHSITIKHYG